MKGPCAGSHCAPRDEIAARSAAEKSSNVAQQRFALKLHRGCARISRMMHMSRWAAMSALVTLAAGVAVMPRLSGQTRPAAAASRIGEWTHYAADARGTRYAPLDQINASNFNKLEVAWRFKTDNLGPRPEYKLEGTPLMVKGVVYTTAGTRRSVIALDAKTGEQIWVYSLREGARAANAPRQLSGRGVSYWSDNRGDDR